LAYFTFSPFLQLCVTLCTSWFIFFIFVVYLLYFRGLSSLFSWFIFFIFVVYLLYLRGLSFLVNAHAKEGQVVSRRIFGAEALEFGGQFRHCFPVILLAFQETEAAGGAAYVEIQGDGQGGGGDALPETQVYGAFLPHQPAEGQVYPFAGGIGGGVGDVLGIKALVSLGHGFPEKGDAVPDIPRRRKKRFQATVFFVADPEAPTEIPEILFKEGPVDAVFPEFPVIPGQNKGGGIGTQKGEHTFGGTKDEVPPAPGNRGGKKSGDLHIRRMTVTVGKLHRIVGNKFRTVDLPVPGFKFPLEILFLKCHKMYIGRLPDEIQRT
jgi:hypothetical protein